MLDVIRAETAALAAHARAADPATPVPTCPGWDLDRLYRHVGRTHRWVHAMVTEPRPDKLAFDRFLDLAPPATGAAADWLVDGATQLADALDATDPATPMWAWGPDRSARFWSRRMAHEITVHRVDADLAVGLTPRVDAAVAADGIDEFLTNLPGAAWVPGLDTLRGAGETITWTADDGTAWTITLHERGFHWRRGDDARAAARVRGPVGALYLYAWGRRTADDVDLSGDVSLLDRWRSATTL